MKHPAYILLAIVLGVASIPLRAESAPMPEPEPVQAPAPALSSEQFLEQLADDSKVSIVFLSGPMIRSMSHKKMSEFRVTEIADNIESLQLYSTFHSVSASEFKNYLKLRLSEKPALKSISKIRDNFKTLSLYGVPLSKDRYSDLIILTTNGTSQAQLLLFKGNFGPEEMLTLMGETPVAAVTGKTAAPRSSVDKKKDIYLHYLSNTSGDHLEIQIKDPSGKRGKNVTGVYYTYKGERWTARPSGVLKTDDGGILYEFKFPYIAIFGGDRAEIIIDGKTFNLGVLHKK